MSDDCQTEKWKGRCCCNCRYQHEIVKHPWNKGEGKGSVLEKMGYGCEPPEFEGNIVFFDSKHGICEMHDFKVANVESKGLARSDSPA